MSSRNLKIAYIFLLYGHRIISSTDGFYPQKLKLFLLKVYNGHRPEIFYKHTLEHQNKIERTTKNEFDRSTDLSKLNEYFAINFGG